MPDRRSLRRRRHGEARRALPRLRPRCGPARVVRGEGRHALLGRGRLHGGRRVPLGRLRTSSARVTNALPTSRTPRAARTRCRRGGATSPRPASPKARCATVCRVRRAARRWMRGRGRRWTTWPSATTATPALPPTLAQEAPARPDRGATATTPTSARRIAANRMCLPQTKRAASTMRALMARSATGGPARAPGNARRARASRTKWRPRRRC